MIEKFGKKRNGGEKRRRRKEKKGAGGRPFLFFRIEGPV